MSTKHLWPRDEGDIIIGCVLIVIALLAWIG